MGLRGEGCVARIITIAVQALAGVDIEQGHGPAPDTTSVECEYARLLAVAFQCGPVSKDDLYILGFSFFISEPRGEAGWSAIYALFALEVELAVAVAKTHAGEVVGDDP